MKKYIINVKTLFGTGSFERYDLSIQLCLSSLSDFHRRNLVSIQDAESGEFHFEKELLTLTF